jgi:hypothetical protein
MLNVQLAEKAGGGISPLFTGQKEVILRRTFNFDGLCAQCHEVLASKAGTLASRSAAATLPSSQTVMVSAELDVIDFMRPMLHSSPLGECIFTKSSR